MITCVCCQTDEINSLFCEGGGCNKTNRPKEKKSIIGANLAKCNFDTVVVLAVCCGVPVAHKAKGNKLSSRLITVNIKAIILTNKPMITMLKMLQYNDSKMS